MPAEKIHALPGKIFPETMAALIAQRGIEACSYQVDVGREYGVALATELKKFGFKEKELSEQTKASFAKVLVRNSIEVEIVSASFMGAFTEVTVRI